MSNSNSLTTSIMKLTYVKGNPNIKPCRDHKYFDNYLFQQDLENESTYTSFQDGSSEH